MTAQTDAPYGIGERLALFQPIVDARTHGVVGFELLARVTGFTPDGQEFQLVPELPAWMCALSYLQSFRNMGYQLSLLAHVSEQQLNSPTFIGVLIRSLQLLRIPPSCIELEISERFVVASTDFMNGSLAALSQSGFSIFMNKLGSDYLSLSHWVNLPLTGIRIDDDLTRRPQASAEAKLVEAILRIASVRGLRTTACGVHDADAAAELSLLGVHRLQGDFFGPAMDCQRFAQGLIGSGNFTGCALPTSP
jgi:EAL domain-containing protein (putative c-di-GMP-specific phosphodiesterase class I)